jgi:glycosyltransferase involved in cell wall biosynthesis
MGWVTPATEHAYLPIDIRAVAGNGGSIPSRLLGAARAARSLRKFIARENIELIHAHESAPALVAWLATLGTRVPLLLSFHGAEPGRIGLFGTVARTMADHTITPSHASARDLVATGKLRSDQITVLGLGIADRPAPAPEETARLRESLLGATGNFLVVTVARLAHQKGIDILVETARQALASNAGLRFVVVGDGPQRADAQHWATAAGVADRVHFAGYSDEPHRYMAAADLFLLPSRWESLPLTIVESFRAGVPVIATDTGGVRELVDETVGCVLPTGDAAGLAQEVIRIAGDDALRRHMSERALARSREQRFSPEHVHERFAQLYTDTLRKHGRKSVS